MSAKFWNNGSFIKMLTALSTSPRQRTALIQTASSEQLKVVLELVGNTLGGVLKFSQDSLAALKAKRNVYKRLWARGHSLAVKRRELVKHIRSLTVLLKAIHSDVTDIIHGGSGEKGGAGARRKKARNDKEAEKEETENYGPPSIPSERIIDSENEIEEGGDNDEEEEQDNKAKTEGF